MIVPGTDKLLAGDVEGTLGAARAPTSDLIRNCFERRVPVDSVTNDHLLGIARPLRGKCIGGGISVSTISSSGPMFFPVIASVKYKWKLS